MRGAERAGLWLRGAIAGLMAIGAMGCSQKRVSAEVDRGMCFAERPAGLRKEAWNDWNAPALASLLVSGYDRDTGNVAMPATDCAGTPILWQEPDAAECQEIFEHPTPLPTAPVRSQDVVINPELGDRRLVWVVVRRYNNGEGEGPVALVDSTERGHSVRALGTLRAMTSGAKLSLQVVGGQEWLAAEGESCSPGQEGPTCQRRIRVLAMKGGRFRSEILWNAAGACVGPAVFHVDRRAVLPLSSGWARRFELTSAVEFKDGRIRVQEQIAVKDWDRNEPGTPPRLFRRAQSERTVRVEQGRLVVDVPSLWRAHVDAAAVEEKPGGRKGTKPARGGRDDDRGELPAGDDKRAPRNRG